MDFNYVRNIFIFLLLWQFQSSGLTQPQITLPRPSFPAEISQTIGLTKITINYHRPGVKGRVIWGELVPYDVIWRAGANENTVISFSDPIKVEGKNLPAGRYGLHMIPGKETWIIIFSNVSWAWGSYGYDEKEDALRVKVKPGPAPFEERLSYRFDNPTENSVEVTLYWERICIPFRIEIDLHSIVLKSIRKELRDLPQFFWQGWYQAAAYCLQNNFNQKEALEWIEKSTSMNENFYNLNTKAGLMKQIGQIQEADNILKKAINIATESEMNFYGFQLMGENKIDEAIEIFKKNVKNHPNSWYVYESLGEAYTQKGDIKNAINQYSKALRIVKDETQKKRINELIEQLKSR